MKKIKLIERIKKHCVKPKKTPDENCDDGIDKDKWRKLKEEQDYCTENTETQCDAASKNFDSRPFREKIERKGYGIRYKRRL